MTQRQPDPNWITAYDSFFRRDAHQLLAWGYEDARTNINSTLEETEITGFIAEKIDKRFDDPDTPSRFQRYYLGEDKPITGEGRTGKSRRRLDLVIEWSGCQPRPKYVFEAKRLRKKGYSISKYTGEDGLQPFVAGTAYAAQYPEAAMIGYIQSDNYEYWIRELTRKFTESNNGLSIIQELTQIEVIASLPNELVSQHDRSTGSPITVYHILLDCSEISI
ncbi:hypothetical protein [Aphanizomenon flos-aquae]|uniref:Restriction endonuclease n=1 Tax=Aphanizomenon flos-aquae FACHB-1040 TaxID=2692887 RepID=A0ABR8BPG2_APHFL|nr:hypothetical protein [Aphanizomenon flos-aquae]MBD2276834.1 hypothetical protein [Aphanizomenon flos-aquae FACHB-1040]